MLKCMLENILVYLTWLIIQVINMLENDITRDEMNTSCVREITS